MLSPAAKLNVPPAPELPLPTDTLTAPPLPLVAAPLPTEIDPLLPELDVPELNTNRPLTPVTPALAVLIEIAPLVVDEPAPLLTTMWPPVTALPVPDDKLNAPPWPAVVLLP